MHYSIGGEGKLLKIELGDGLTKEKILALWDAVENSPLYPEATSVLVTFAPIVKWHVSNVEMLSLAKRAQRFKPMRWAIVATDAMSFGMSRMFASQVEDESTYFVCSDVKTARDWLRSSSN